MRLHGKIVRLLDFSLKCVKVVMGHLYALDILTRGADEVVVMVGGGNAHTLPSCPA